MVYYVTIIIFSGIAFKFILLMRVFQILIYNVKNVNITVKLTQPWTPEIFMECYCVARNKPIRREIT